MQVGTFRLILNWWQPRLYSRGQWNCWVDQFCSGTWLLKTTDVLVSTGSVEKVIHNTGSSYWTTFAQFLTSTRTLIHYVNAHIGERLLLTLWDETYEWKTHWDRWNTAPATSNSRVMNMIEKMYRACSYIQRTYIQLTWFDRTYSDRKHCNSTGSYWASFTTFQTKNQKRPREKGKA